MPDLGPAVGALFEAFGPILGEALAAFLGTTVGMACLGLALAGGSFWYAAQGSPLHGVLAALLALTLAIGVGVMLGMKRAIARALQAGLEKNSLGARALGAIFARMEGGAAARAAARLPLAQAESLLRSSVEEIVAATPSGGGIRGAIRRKVQGALLGKVETITLARFREEQDGVELARVKAALGARIDALVVEKVKGAAGKVTVLMIGALVLGCVAGAVGIRRLPF